MSAAPVPSATRLTYEEYLAGPRIEGKYDIIDGEVVFDRAASYISHMETLQNVFFAFRSFQRASKQGKALAALAEVLITRSPLRIRQPDVFFVSTERLERIGGLPEEGPLPIGPELVAEVFSRGETPRSMRAKLEDYRAVGVREAWLVSREAETVQVLRLDGPDGIGTVAVYANGQSVASFCVPGLTVALADIFAED